MEELVVGSPSDPSRDLGSGTVAASAGRATRTRSWLRSRGWVHIVVLHDRYSADIWDGAEELRGAGGHVEDADGR